MATYAFYPCVQMRNGVVYPDYFNDGNFENNSIPMVEAVKDIYSAHIARTALAMCTELTDIRVVQDPVRKLPSIEFILKDRVDTVALNWMICADRWCKGPSTLDPFKWDGQVCRVYGRWTPMSFLNRGIMEAYVDLVETTKQIEELTEKRESLKGRLSTHVYKSPEYKRALNTMKPSEAMDFTIETMHMRGAAAELF
jgi:hypothetical protein